jgi:hypothetical protein
MGDIGTTELAAHATNHKSGGTDPVKVDELAAPADNSNLNATTGAHGLLKKLDNVITHFMNGQGNWTTIPAGALPTITTGMLPSNVTLNDTTQTISGNKTFSGNNIFSGNDTISGIQNFDNYRQVKIIAAPGVDPTTGYLMEFAKVVDSNNDTMVVKQRVGGVMMEVYG